MNNKIAFFISLKKIKNKLKNIDIDKGNPGIGGTQYTFFLNVKYINRLCNNLDACIITDEVIDNFDFDIPIVYVEKIEYAIKYCEKNEIETLVINANIVDKISQICYDTSLNIFIWAHNTLNRKSQSIATEKSSIKKVICVSENQYKNMSDTSCFNKCIYINNAITKSFYDKAIVSDYSKKSVIYVGSIVPQKGVHNLINIWKYVEEVHPDAQLYIFGGASIWDENLKLGKLNIADKYYEKIIQNKLNKIKNKDNIHFMGLHGWKEIECVAKNARIGIVNPSKYMRDETFCISAIEVQAHGIPIVTRNRNDGLLSTVLHGKTGYLEKKDKKIASRIIELLSSQSNNEKMGNAARNFVKKFIIDAEVEKWNIEINNIDKNNHSNKKRKIFSTDTIMLFHDFCLKIFFLLYSGKFIYLIKKRIFKNNK